MNNKLVFILISLAFVQNLAIAEDDAKDVRVDLKAEETKGKNEEVGATLKDDAKLKPEDSADGEGDEALRKKKSTTTFCVEIRPSGSYQPFELCEKENNELKRPPFGEPAYSYPALPPSPPTKVVYPSYSAVRDEPKPAYAKQIQSPYSPPPPPPTKSIYSSYSAPQKSQPAPAYGEVKQTAYQPSKKLISYGASASEEVKSGSSSFSKSSYQASKQIENEASSHSSSFDQPQPQQYRSKEEVLPPASVRVEEAPKENTQQRSNEPSGQDQSVSIPRESDSEQRSNEATLQTSPEQSSNSANMVSSRTSEQINEVPSSTPPTLANNARESDYYGEPEYSAPAQHDTPEYTYIPVIKPSLKNLLLQKLSKKISGLTVSCQPYVKYVKGSSSDGYSAYRSAYGSDSASFGAIEEDDVPVPTKDVHKTTKTVLYSIPLMQSDISPENDYGGGQSRGPAQISAYIPIQISEQFVPIQSQPGKVVPAPASPSPSPNSVPVSPYPAPVKVTKQPQYHQQSYHAPHTHSAPAQYAYSAPSPAPQKSFNYAAPSYSNFKSPPTYKQSEEAKKTEETQLKSESREGDVVAAALERQEMDTPAILVEHRGIPSTILMRTVENDNGMTKMAMLRGNRLVPIELIRVNEADKETVAAAPTNQEMDTGSSGMMAMLRGDRLVPIENLPRSAGGDEAVTATSSNQETTPRSGWNAETVGNPTMMMMRANVRDRPVNQFIIKEPLLEGETVGNPTMMRANVRDRTFSSIRDRLVPSEFPRGQNEESSMGEDRVGSPTSIILNEDPMVPLPIFRANEALTQNMMRSRWGQNSVFSRHQGPIGAELVEGRWDPETRSAEPQAMTSSSEMRMNVENKDEEPETSRAALSNEDGMRRAEEVPEVKDVRQDEPQNGQARSSDVTISDQRSDSNVEEKMRRGSGSNDRDEKTADETQRRNQERTSGATNRNEEEVERENDKARTAFFQNPLSQFANAAKNVAALVEKGEVLTTDSLRDLPQQTAVNPPPNMF